MENLAHFIHEEIFLVNDAAKASSPPIATTPLNKLGIVAADLNADDEQLLNDILKAIKMDRQEVILAQEPTESSRLWLIFSEVHTVDGTQIRPTIKVELKSKRLILAHPLKVLRDSKQEKAALWLILKEEFGL